MKIKIEIKSWINGSILFEYEKENNTIKDTLIEAVSNKKILQGADLRGADLRGADLRGAYLQGAYLQGAYLQGAYLRGADLRGVDLQGADLQGVDLQGADLWGVDLWGAYLLGADLQGADLQGAYLQGEKIKTAIVFTGLYQYIVIPYVTETGVKRIKMGCFNRTLDEWNENFWNNDNEFPNNGSLKSNIRLMAFETAKKWLDLIESDSSKL